MLIGIDFDNTIVCYDRLFHTLALEAGLIPARVDATKRSVADWLRKSGRGHDWTELQGRAYGPEIHRAEVFPGVLEFLRDAHTRGIPTIIISHKTPHALSGPPHDLRASALDFLRRSGFFDASTGLTEARVFFEPTKSDKLTRIGSEGCTHFIDDLTDVLDDPEFPPNVRKLHFGASIEEPGHAARSKLPSWWGAWDVVFAPHFSVPEPPRERVERLLNTAGLPHEGYVLKSLAGGRNNRTYVATTSDRRRALLKWYFQHPDDVRDRLAAEFGFTKYCRRHEIDVVPAPSARDDQARLGLYEFFERAETSPTGLEREHVEQALDFVLAVQRYRTSEEARALQPASEACLTHVDHWEHIDGRIGRLLQAASTDETATEFREFVCRRLKPAWESIADRMWSAPSLMPKSSFERCLSPSDFGFHNALQGSNGRLRFFDFEYAGWDDPAKLLCDFFCQVEVPVPLEYAPWFAQSLLADFTTREECLARAEACFAAYRIKWCTIVLNEFLPAGAARRTFGHAPPSPERLAAQLAKAEAMLDRLMADGDRPIFTVANAERAS